MLLSYNNEFLLESIVFLACPAVLRISMTQGKPLKITHSQTIVVSRFTKRNIDLMQKVYMNLFHLLAIYFTKSVFFFFINRDQSWLFRIYTQRRESRERAIVDLSMASPQYRFSSNLEFIILSPSYMYKYQPRSINVGRRCVII